MSKIICHAHCPRGRGGGLGLVVAAVIGVVTAATAVRAEAPAIESAVRTALEVLKIAAITTASLCGVAGLGWLARVRLQARSEHAPERQAISSRVSIAQPRSAAISAPRQLAIEASRPALADLSALEADHDYDVVIPQTTED
jgi:hypothetical protein